MALSHSTSLSVKGCMFVLLALGFSSANKLLLILSTSFESRVAYLVSKALLLSVVLLPFKSLALHWSKYNCCCCAVNIEPYSSLEYFFNSIFPLKVTQTVLVFCHLAGLIWATDATSILGVGSHLLIHCMKKAMAACPSFANYCGQLVAPNAIQ